MSIPTRYSRSAAYLILGLAHVTAPVLAAEPAAPATGQPVAVAAPIPELDFSPQEELVVRGRDTANWVLSYPAAIPLQPPAHADWAADAREAAGRGALAESILILDGVPAEKQDAAWRVYRANVLLRIGMLDEADATLAPVLSATPSPAGAQAMASVLASIRGKLDQAEALAQSAIRDEPASGAAWLALSYTQQARGRLADARESVRRAQSADPGNATAWIRDAELALAQGQRPEARLASEHAIQMQPGSAIAHGIRALAALLESDWAAARAGFENAVRLNPSDANARFGLALVHIQAGEPARARDELEIATGRAPGNALFHAYLGRVYLALGDTDKAWLHIERAKELDPNNPATWLFAGQLHLEENKPASALDDVRASIAHNEGRKVYRESTLLNEDQALNQIDLSRALGALGFQEPALWAAQTAFRDGAQGNAASRNLADLYGQTSRGLTARRSLALQSLFDAPLGQLPLALDVAQAVGGGAAANVPSHGLPATIESRPAGLNEYSGVFSAGNWQAALDSNVGGYDTWGEQLRLAGHTGGLGIGFAQLVQKSDGPDGKALDNRNLQFLLQAQTHPDFSAFLEYREGNSEREEALFPYDPAFQAQLALEEESRTARLGARLALGPQSSLRALFSRQWFDGVTTSYQPAFPPAVTYRTHQTGNMPELQFMYHTELLKFILGASHIHDETQYQYTASSAPFDQHVRLVYAYGTLQPDTQWTVTFGLANGEYKAYSGTTVQYSRNLPKLGLQWTPISGTIFRLAAMEAMGLPKVGGAGLEPVEVAGQLQWFGDEIGTVVRRFSLAWEQTLGSHLSLLASLGNDRLSIPYTLGGPTLLDHQYERWSRAGLYWRMPANWLTGWEGGMRLTYDRLEQDRTNAATIDLNNLQRQLAGHWALGAQLAGPHGLGLAATLTRVNAEQTFTPFTLPSFNDAEDFWMLDVAASKTFQRGRGRLSLGVRNASNRDIGKYQEVDPQSPRFSPHRFTYARLSWRFD